MAKLILTPEEQSAALWTHLDDAALGAMLRKRLVTLKTASDQQNWTTSFAGALILCCHAAEENAQKMRLQIDGVTQGGRDFGDWEITVMRKIAKEGDAA